MMSQTLAARLKNILQKKAMSVRELERQAGLKSSVVQNILVGRSKIPTIRTLMAICDALGCTVEDLTGPSQKSKNPPVALKKEWLPELLMACVTSAIHIFEELNITPHPEEAIDSIKEIYKYCLEQKEAAVDQNFAKWLIQREFLKL